VLLKIDEYEEMGNRVSNPIVEMVTILFAVPPTEQFPEIVVLRFPEERGASLYLYSDEKRTIE
jgi:hypothetical protein